MTIINDGGTTRSRRIRVQAQLDRPLAAGEQLHLWQGSRDVGAGTELSPTLYEWVDTVSSAPPGGNTQYRARFLPANGGQYTDSAVRTVIVDDQLLAAVLGVFLPPIANTITTVQVETILGPAPPELSYNVTSSTFIMDPITLMPNDVIWIGVTLPETTSLIIDTGLSPTDTDSSLAIFGPSGNLLAEDDDGWGGDDSDYRSRLVTPVLTEGVLYYLAITQYMPTWDSGWVASTNGEVEFPGTIIRFAPN
jgi:hypothetical protein